MAPESRSVGIVQVHDRLSESALKGAANVEAGPIVMHKVCRAPGAQHTLGAGWAGSVKAHRSDVVHGHTRAGQCRRRAFRDLVDADFGPLYSAGRMLTQTFNQDVLFFVDDRIVDSGSAKIDPDYIAHDCLLSVLEGTYKCTACRF